MKTDLFQSLYSVSFLFSHIFSFLIALACYSSYSILWIFSHATSFLTNHVCFCSFVENKMSFARFNFQLNIAYNFIVQCKLQCQIINCKIRDFSSLLIPLCSYHGYFFSHAYVLLKALPKVSEESKSDFHNQYWEVQISFIIHIW